METVIVCGAAPSVDFIKSLLEENHTVLLLRDDLDIQTYACFEDVMEFSILLQSATANPLAVKATIETVMASTVYYVRHPNREIDVEQIVVKFIVKSIDKAMRPKFVEVVPPCQRN